MSIWYTANIKSEMAQMQRQLALMVEKDIDKVIRDLPVLKVNQDYL